jgi:aspartate racemase
MRYLGLLGGMSWESTAEYYRLINRAVAERCGGLHSAPLLVHSVDFAAVAALQAAGDWASAGRLLGEAAAGLERAGVRRVGLLGTRYTMELPFWRERLAERAGIDVVVPNAADRALVHRVIYEELVRGRIEPSSRDAYVEVIRRLGDAGAEGVVLGCTEITLLVGAGDSPLPTFDTTALHADAAARFVMDAA